VGERGEVRGVLALVLLWNLELGLYHFTLWALVFLL
jgi:hypothetical protein